jgi:hypothetical protein
MTNVMQSSVVGTILENLSNELENKVEESQGRVAYAQMKGWDLP